MKHYVPEDTKEMCSPFFGGGALEIYLANKGIKVYGYDGFDLLVDFWKGAISHPIELASIAEIDYPLSKERFYEIQEKIHLTDDEKVRGALFYILNRASYSGTTLSGGMSPSHPRFNESAIERLRSFNAKNLSVEHMDFEESIELHMDKFLYCDPPYYIGDSLYGNRGDKHKGFDHERLAKVLSEHNNWILSYNNCEYIRNLYKDYRQEFPEWSYGMGKEKESKEILIINTK